jgi:hypothetical protein
MPVVDVGLRPGDHKDLKQIAERIGRPAKEVAGILLEQAIRRESAELKTAGEPATGAGR